MPPSDTDTTTLPPVAPEVLAAAVEGLTSRLRKKLDATIERYAELPVTVEGEVFRVRCGEDAEVALVPGAGGVVSDAGQATCGCLLAPRCLHRAAVLGACPVADPADLPDAPADPPAGEPPAPGASGGPPGTGTAPAAARPSGSPGSGTAVTAHTLTAAQTRAAAGLWSAATAVLAAGLPGAGAVVQAELLRAAHTARLAGLLRGEAAALRVVRGLRGARARHDTHRLAGLVTALHELLLTTARLAAADGDPTLVGTARQKYRPGGSLRVLGVFREPVISATGYGGVVTHLLGDDGRWFSVADVRPGGPARARAAGNATVAIGAATLDHARLARGGLLVTGATVSPDGRLGSGRGVRATPLPGATWTSEPLAHLFARPLADVVAERLAGAAPASAESGDALDPAGDPVGCDLVVVGAAGDHLLARELPRPSTGPGGDAAARPDAGDDPAAEPTGPLIRLVPANSHPDLAHTDNLRRLASRPGLRLRVIGRLATDRAATLRPLAVGPVPGDEACTLRLPDAWLGRADLGYDRLQGTHLPPEDACPRPPDAHVGPDPLADSPLWRTRRLVELAVAGGRRAVAESGRGGDRTGAALRGAGMPGAAELCAALTAEADRRGRDAFGRLADPDPDSYARAWLATAVHLAATERVLVESSWRQREAPSAMLS